MEMRELLDSLQRVEEVGRCGEVGLRFGGPQRPLHPRMELFEFRINRNVTWTGRIGSAAWTTLQAAELEAVETQKRSTSSPSGTL